MCLPGISPKYRIMATFACMQPPPPPGWVTLLERECSFVAVKAEDRAGGPRGQANWIHDVIATAIPHLPSEDRRMAFLPVEEQWAKQAFVTWRDYGLLKAVEQLAEGRTGQEGAFLGRLVALARAVARHTLGLRGGADMLPREMSRELCSSYSLTREWGRSSICALALHPRLPFMALGLQEGVIEVKRISTGLQHEPSPGVSLRDKMQQDITCLEWAPHCNNLLAVGSGRGVLLWHVDLACASNRLLTSWVRAETAPCHAPVTSISWSPLGQSLVSASPADVSLIVWDIPMGVAVRVSRARGGGLALVVWSPDGQRVLAASTSALMRVWDTQHWACERWTQFSGRCKAACWSPKGDILLFALEGDPTIYYIGFHGNETNTGSLTAVHCADLTPTLHTHPTTGAEMMVGGCVESMVWDRSGERLAIIFTSDSPSADVVAVLRTPLSPVLELQPGGFVRGLEGETPVLAEFQRSCVTGAQLAVAWSSGRVSFVPLLFQRSSDVPTMYVNSDLLDTPTTITPLYSKRT